MLLVVFIKIWYIYICIYARVLIGEIIAFKKNVDCGGNRRKEHPPMKTSPLKTKLLTALLTLCMLLSLVPIRHLRRI